MSSCTTAQDYLRSFRARFDPVLEDYLLHKCTALQSVHPLGRDLAKILMDFVTAEGKRLRPALVELGYLACGNIGTADILQPGIGVETLHGFFLVHDDVIDLSATRRNRPTVHRVLASEYRDILAGQSPTQQEHIAQSMAILVGDLMCSIAYESLTKSAFVPERIIAALQFMHRMMDATVVGEGLDVLLPYQGPATMESVLTVHRLKTAMYTFVCPMQLGMTLGGASPELLAGAERFGIPVGIAFQIQDDYLGLFGDEQELGKSVTSDVEEGKQTLLTVYASEHATVAQRDRLTALLGKSPIAPEELADVREIVTASGAVSYSYEMAQGLVEEGLRALDAVMIPEDVCEILRGIAEYVVRRTT